MKSTNTLASTLLLSCALVASNAQASTRKIPNLGPNAKFITYYGPLTDEMIAATQGTQLAIIKINEENGTTREQIQQIQKGRDGVRGTKDDVTVIAYLTIGEHDLSGGQPLTGDGSGPTQFDATGKIVGKAKNGVASFYVDACDGDKFKTDGRPDKNPGWESYIVNPVDPAWRKLLKTEADTLLNTYGADGLFLDTLDTAQQSNCKDGGGYAGLLQGMSDTVKWLYESYPTKYMIANRGFFLLKDGTFNIRPYISALMTENHFTEWKNNRAVKSPYNYSSESALMNAQSTQADGFQVLVLDYINEDQDDCSKLVKWQSDQVQAAGQGRWMNFLSASRNDQIDLESFSTPVCRK
jgi:endo-alpha-1,4-polygalactosaminidase (GH114 family)